MSLFGSMRFRPLCDLAVSFGLDFNNCRCGDVGAGIGIHTSFPRRVLNVGGWGIVTDRWSGPSAAKAHGDQFIRGKTTHERHSRGNGPGAPDSGLEFACWFPARIDQFQQPQVNRRLGLHSTVSRGDMDRSTDGTDLGKKGLQRLGQFSAGGLSGGHAQPEPTLGSGSPELLQGFRWQLRQHPHDRPRKKSRGVQPLQHHRFCIEFPTPRRALTDERDLG
jgi:hypothetical protein